MTAPCTPSSASAQEIKSLLQQRLHKKQHRKETRGGGSNSSSTISARSNGRRHKSTTPRLTIRHERCRQVVIDPINQTVNSNSNSLTTLSSLSPVKIFNKKYQARGRAAFFSMGIVLVCSWAIISETSFLTKHLQTSGNNDYVSNFIPYEWNPLNLDESLEKAVGDTLDEVESHSKVSFVGSDMSDKRCWIPANDIRLVGCGSDGMVFSATMECSDSTRRVVTMKVPTSSYNESAIPPITFMTDSNKTYLRNTEQIYEALYKNTTTTIRQHFAVAFGTVSISPDLFLKAVETHKQSPKSDRLDPEPYCYEILLPPLSSNSSTSSNLNAPSFSTEALVLATVDEFATGSFLRPQELTSLDERRRVAQDFICIYQHQYERKFIHADILNFHHFFYDGNHVTLVDYSRVLFANDQYGDFRQKMQLFQLVALLGNICARSEKKFDVTHATSSPKGNDQVDSMRRALSSALKPCTGRGEQKTGDGSGSQELLPKPLREPLFSERNFSTELTYQILSDWSGGCRGKNSGTISLGRQ